MDPEPAIQGVEQNDIAHRVQAALLGAGAAAEEDVESEEDSNREDDDEEESEDESEDTD